MGGFHLNMATRIRSLFEEDVYDQIRLDEVLDFTMDDTLNIIIEQEELEEFNKTHLFTESSSTKKKKKKKSSVSRNTENDEDFEMDDMIDEYM